MTDATATPRPRPTGTVTLLFTDIEGSTVRWEERREAMAEALARHDALLREAVEKHGGYVFKTVGDACYAVFWRASDALLAASDGQGALRAQDWSALGDLKVRMALHSGATDERDGDYFGPVVNRIARLLGAAHGGQVVISGATALLLRGMLPEPMELLDLGEHRLKDLTDPEHVWQLVSPGLADMFPPLRSLGSVPNNLPRQLTPLVGRDQAVLEIKALLETSPLVTVVGTGGVGKTRASLQVAAELIDGSNDGVWFVELAALSDPNLTAPAISAALGIAERPDRQPLETLLHHIKNKRLLLVLDNCEHVIEEAARVAHAILQASPEVRLLATSREALRISGESVYTMPPLAIPSGALTGEDVLGYGAPALFVERARAADPQFELTADNASLVTEIVRQLDGLPLAIELAAARMKLLRIEDLAKRLDRKLAILTSGNRGVSTRQQTMRAAIEWSYELLSEEEKGFFRACSIFVGRVSLDAIARTASQQGIDDLAALELLTSLVDKSLISVDADGDKRYRVLESTREFASAELVGRGEHAAIARAHALAFLELAEELETAWGTTPEEQWRHRARTYLENWRAALEWSLAGGAELLIGLRLLAALPQQRVWFFTLAERRRWLSQARQAVDESTPAMLAAKVDLYEAQLSALSYRWDAVLVAARRAAAAFSELDDDICTAKARRYAGYALTQLGNAAEGEASLQAALEIYRERNDEREAASILHDIGDARNIAGDVAGARAYYDEALQIYKANGARESAIGLMRNLAEAEFRAGEVVAALDLAREALEFDRQSNNQLHIVEDLLNICAYETALRKFESAKACGLEALALAATSEAEVYSTIALQHAAVIVALGKPREAPSLEHLHRAARLLGYAQARLAALKVRCGFSEQQGYDAAIAVLRETLDDEKIALLSAEGAAWSEARAIAEARLA
ncbi:MAG TPA: tetratricopeptide repeat protein [Candidatus Cybelea sp.]|nr:tetratricopeptide repeat protein [Candidatus Cybelea sp.]